MMYINCSECDATISDKALACPHCGAPVVYEKEVREPAQEQSNCQQNQQSQCQTRNYTGPGVKEMPPKTWLLESILATLFCCLPFGIVGIVYAAKVESSWYGGDRERSMAASRSAKTWTIISFCVGLAGILGYIVALALGLAATSFGGLFHAFS